MASSVDLESVPFGWFRAWCERFEALGVSLDIFAPAAVVPIPVFICWIAGDEQFGPKHRRFAGTSAHPDAETALFKALAEAVQSRLTFIAAVRDDMLPSAYHSCASALAPVPPLPPGFPERRWTEMPPTPAGDIAAQLVEAGYNQIAVKRLDRGLDGVAVVKAFVPGLGSLTRERRQ
jgi:ribosomal protein S12 methylthiotransferase accessory factor